MQRPYLIHALSPLHPGTGQAQGAIDLPIARLAGTGIPFLPGSSVKGVLRDAFTGNKKDSELPRELIDVFGPPVKLDNDQERRSGAVAFGDARLLALPVKSFYGTFAWVTSPLLLRLARRDLGWTELAIPLPRPPQGSGAAAVGAGAAVAANGHVFLQDIECPLDDDAGVSEQVGAWGNKLAALAFDADDQALFTERFVVVDDETMTFVWESCTQVDARVRINERGVVQDGALWYEESLPAETLLIGVAAVIKRHPGGKPEEWLDYCLGASRDTLQFGGKATVGRGRARLLPVKSGGAE
jgi:CRISPR-associated protein Cmr4